jgi:hypothetical protein
VTCRFLFHIGAAKTGSSAIQTFLRRNAPALAESGFIVPDRFLGLGGNITGEHVWAIQERINARDKEGLAARLAEAAELAGDGKTLLMSAENLSNLGNHRYLIEAMRGRDARVIVYIRRQDELLTSAWQQWHSKIESDFTAWLLKGVRSYGLWDRLIADWEDVVGARNVDVRIFEREAMVDNDLLKDYVTAIGLAERKSAFEYDFGVVNPSFSDIITPLVAGNKRVFEDSNDNRFFNFVAKIDPEMFAKGKKVSLISRATRESICAYYQEINNTICKKYFPDRNNLFSPVDHNKYNYLEGDTLTHAQMRFLLEFTYRSHQYLEKTK